MDKPPDTRRYPFLPRSPVSAPDSLGALRRHGNVVLVWSLQLESRPQRVVALCQSRLHWAPCRDTAQEAALRNPCRPVGGATPAEERCRCRVVHLAAYVEILNGLR